MPCRICGREAPLPQGLCAQHFKQHLCWLRSSPAFRAYRDVNLPLLDQCLQIASTYMRVYVDASRRLDG